MLIDLRKIEDSAVDFDFLVEPADVDLEIRYSNLKHPAEFKGRVTKDGWVAHVEGKSNVLVERRCDRCFSKVDAEYDVDFECAYVKSTSLNEEKETKLEIMGLEYSVIDGDTLDLTEVFSEQLLTEMPDRFVCAADCEGLCPECGRRKDSDECDCGEKGIDPRWAALKNLK